MTATYNNTLGKFRIADDLPLFHIATSYGRVSFIAQQWRALALAQSLKQHFKGHEANIDIAIVGGGVSGVTALVALHMHGFDKAVLYEAQEQVLGTQAACEHRHAHPSYNFWPFSPQADRDFPATTALPFLNWHADRVSAVIEQIKADPFLCALEKSGMEKILTGKKLTKVALAGSKNSKDETSLNITFWDILEGKKDRPTKVDALILTTGFGQEKNLNSSRSGSYWWSDHIKHYRSEHQYYAAANAFVSGNGDGALIDYVRFRSKARNEYDRDEKNVSLALMGELRPPRFRMLNPSESSGETADSTEEKVRGIYREAKAARKNAAAQPDTKDQVAYEMALALFNERVSGLAADLTATRGARGTPADEDCRRIGAFLANRFRVRTSEVKLVVRSRKDETGLVVKPPPFRPDASPANIVLAALLMNGDPENHIAYGRVDKDKQELLLDESGVIPSTDIHVARNGVESWRDSITFDGELERMIEKYETKLREDADQNLIEHVGSGHKLDHIIDSDSLDLSRYQPSNKTLKALKVAQLAKARHALAHGFFAKVDQEAAVRQMKAGSKGAIRFVVALSDPKGAERSMREMGGVERNAFGCEVDFELESLTASTAPQEVKPDVS